MADPNYRYQPWSPERRALASLRASAAWQKRNAEPIIEAARGLIAAGFTHVQRPDGIYSIAELALLGDKARPLCAEACAALNLPQPPTSDVFAGEG